MRNSYLILDEYVSAYMYKSLSPNIALYCFYFCFLWVLLRFVCSQMWFHCLNTVENIVLNSNLQLLSNLPDKMSKF